MTVKILHVSDTHLGYRQYHSDLRRQDYTNAFEEAINIAIEEEVDAVLHTGDLYHTKTPNLKTQMEATRTIRKLDEANIPFLAIVGNHERKRDDQFIDYMSMTLDNIFRLGNEGPWVKGEIAVHGFDHIVGPQWSTTDLTLPNVDVEHEIVGMHQLFEPIAPDHYDPLDVTDALNRFGKTPDILAVGDLHDRVIKEIDGTKVHYPGSTERTSRNEPSEKFVSLISVGEDGLEIDAIPIESREFTTLEVFLEDDDPISELRTQADLVDLDGCVVTVELYGEDITIPKPKIKEVLYNEGAVVVRVDDNRTTDVEIEAVDYGSVDIESAIESELDSRNLSETAHEIDSIVRDREVKKSHVRGEVEENLINNFRH